MLERLKLHLTFQVGGTLAKFREFQYKKPSKAFL